MTSRLDLVMDELVAACAKLSIFFSLGLPGTIILRLRAVIRLLRLLGRLEGDRQLAHCQSCIGRGMCARLYVCSSKRTERHRPISIVDAPIGRAVANSPQRLPPVLPTSVAGRPASTAA